MGSTPSPEDTGLSGQMLVPGAAHTTLGGRWFGSIRWQPDGSCTLLERTGGADPTATWPQPARAAMASVVPRIRRMRRILTLR